MNVFRDRIYAPRRKTFNKLDIYSPLKGKLHPVVVFVHGGSYLSGDKLSSVFHKASWFTSHDLVFVSIDYRLSPRVKYPSHAEDVVDAIGWVYKNIGRFGGDPTKMFLMGHSAGAQLVALVSTDQKLLERVDLSLSNLSGAILLDGGTYNLPVSARSAHDDRMLRSVFGTNPENWWQASAIAHVSARKSIPPFLLFGISQTTSGWTQAQALNTALQRAQVKSTLVLAKGKTHATLNEDIGLVNDQPTKQIYSFIKLISQNSRTVVSNTDENEDRTIPAN